MFPAFPKDFSEDLIIDILTPLMEYADTLAGSGEHRAQGLLLLVLIAHTAAAGDLLQYGLPRLQGRTGHCPRPVGKTAFYLSTCPNVSSMPG